MTSHNLLDEIQSAPWSKVEFPASMRVGEQQVSCNVTIDPDGAIIHLKQGDILLPRENWAVGAATDQSVVLIVVGLDYASWLKKLKQEKKNPGKVDPVETSQVYAWNLTFNPKKLGPELVQQLKHTVLRSDIENYLSSLPSNEQAYLVKCPTCESMMDVAPYADNSNLYCNNCNRFLNAELNVEDANYGICTGCSYYTKLKSNNAASGKPGGSVCHRCYARSTSVAFLTSLGIAIGVGVLNVFTIVFMDRFFPILLIIGAVSLLWSLIKFFGVIMSTMTRTAVGVTPLEKATAALRKGKPEEALKLIESMPNATSNPGILLNLSRGLINASNYAKANQFTELLVSEFPNFQLGHAARIEALVGSGASQEDIADANEEFNEVMSRNQLRPIKNLL